MVDSDTDPNLAYFKNLVEMKLTSSLTTTYFLVTTLVVPIFHCYKAFIRYYLNQFLGKRRRKKGTVTESDTSTISSTQIYNIIDGLKNKQFRSTTGENYHGIWNNFNKFLIKLDYKPPTWEERVILYAGYLIDKGIKSATLKSYISAIKKTLELDGYNWSEDKVMFNALTKACKLENDHVRTRLPVQRGLLEMLLIELIRYFHDQIYLQYLYKCMFSTGYFGMMRIGEMASGSHPVKAKDIYVSKSKQKMKLYLYSSKTHGRETRPQTIRIEGDDISAFENDYFNPYDILQDFLNIRGDYDNDNEALFIFRDKSPVKPDNFRQVFKKMLRRLNLNHKLYDTHSFRIGRATDMQKLGFSIEQIKHYGRWKSNAVYKYLQL